MISIHLPAELWQSVSAANSCHLVVEHKGNKPLSVRTTEYGGFLYTAFATMWGPYGIAIKPYIDAYRLLPASVYVGETTLVYRDEKAIQAGLRERGDHTGLIVSAKGKSMVCAERVRFFLDLPSTRPLSFADAKDYDESQRKSGWRALRFKGKGREWLSLRGHPVAVYRDHSTLHKDYAVLFWGAKGEIHELFIDNDVILSPLGELQTAPSVTTPESQLALF
jgi:hypothetical protein